MGRIIDLCPAFIDLPLRSRYGRPSGGAIYSGGLTILGLFWAYHGSILGLSWVYFGSILGLFSALKWTSRSRRVGPDGEHGDVGVPIPGNTHLIN